MHHLHEQHSQVRPTTSPRPESPIHERPPSPVYRNGTEYSPQPNDLSDHSSSRSSVKSPGSDLISERTPPPLELDVDLFITDEDSSQVITSGRSRKGRPKKLVRDDQEEGEEEEEDMKSVNRNNNTQKKQETDVSPKETLTVEIPETRLKSPKQQQSSGEKKSSGSIEEYPVMIIRESGEDSIAKAKVNKKRKNILITKSRS
jgi:hypothetical protein